MSKKWTPEQQQAIDARNEKVLVSAAAGSGKTAVLIERIAELVREKNRIDEMLVITFTRAAAAEMRQRLSERLTQLADASPEYVEALDQLEQADISTIHAFCQRVMKENFQFLGIDPMSRVCEESLRTQLFEKGYREAVNFLSEESDYPHREETKQFFQAVSNDARMKMTDTLYRFLMSMPDPFAWMDGQIAQMNDTPIQEHPWYQVLLQQAVMEVKGLSASITEMEMMFHEANAVEGLYSTWQADAELIEQMKMACEQDARNVSKLSGTGFVRMASVKGLSDEEKEWKERFQKRRNALKAVVKKTAEMVQLDEEQERKDLFHIQAMLMGLAVLVKKTHETFQAEKRKQCVVDFHDLEQMTLAVLKNDQLRAMQQQKYRHIFVDECQDVSAVQDEIVQRLNRKESSLFMVGDVKQSIYRFRLADPSLFLGRMKAYHDEVNAEERRIFLQANFRSRTNVLDATNRVFRSAMQEDVTELDYPPEAELYPGRNTQEDPPVEVHLVRSNGKGTKAELESEALCVVKRIQELLHCKNEKTGESYRYRDMVILLSKTAGIGARLSEILESQGIPVYFDGKDDYYGLPEVRSVCELLRVIDNQYNDLSLLAALKMRPFGLTEAELADIRMQKMGKNVPFWQAFHVACEQESSIGKKCAKICEQWDRWRFLAEVTPLSQLIWQLIRETGFYAACGAYPEGELRQANLRLLCQRAAEYEENYDGTLSGFLRMVDQQMKTTDSTGAKVLGESENLVRIMTMHKSKGLQFPVVFLMRLSGSMGGSNTAMLKIHNKLGLCMPYINRKLNVKRPTFGDNAFKVQREMDERAERCRLLYVAMTRAEERLLMYGCAEEWPKPVWTMQKGSYRVWAAESMLDWVMQAVCDDLDLGLVEGQGTVSEGPWQVVLDDVPALEAKEASAVADVMMNKIQQLVNTPSVCSPFDGGKETEIAPAPVLLKTSVSSMVRHMEEKQLVSLAPEGEEETFEEKRSPQENMTQMLLSSVPSMPAFMMEKKPTAAEIGSLMHYCLSLFDLEKMRGQHGPSLSQTIGEEIDRLLKMGCIKQEEVHLIHPVQLVRFYESEIGQRVLASKNVRRELAFNLCINQENHALLQGIIDCAFMEGGSWVLIDYKTDRITSDEAFVKKHEKQLNWYAEALSVITQIPVKELVLYSLQKHRAYEVQMVKPIYE